MGRALLSPDGRVPTNTTWTEMNSLEARCARWRSGAGAESSAETPCPCVDTSIGGNAPVECDPPTDDRGPFISYFALGLFLALALLAALLVTCKRRFRHRLSLSLLEEAARAERDEIERQKKDAYDRWVLKGVLVTQPDDTTCVVTVCAPDKDAPRAWEEAVGNEWAEPTTLARPQPALPHVVIRLPSFKRRSNVDLNRVAEEETNAARSATEVEREDARRGLGDGDGGDGGDGDGGDDSDSSPGSVVFRQDSLRSWTSDRSGSSEASGSGTRRGDESN